MQKCARCLGFPEALLSALCALPVKGRAEPDFAAGIVPWSDSREEMAMVQESPPVRPTEDRETLRSTELPTQETDQPDPLMQISTGRAGVGTITIAALAIAVILGFVLYGLNSRGSNEQTAAAPPAGSQVHSAQPAAGGKGGAPTPSAPRANESGVKG